MTSLRARRIGCGTVRRAMAPRLLRLAPLACIALALAAPSAASAQSLSDPVDQWLPSSDGASWTYLWDSAFSPQPTKEKYTLELREGQAFRLAWTTEDLDNPDGAVVAQGQMDYRRSDAGLTNTNWASTPPPGQFPVLCPSADNCANSLAGTHYMLIWGNRSPVLLEPLLSGARWSSVGGSGNDVASSSRYLGQTRIKVAAFPQGIGVAKVETQITQAGALGDPYGTGLRTVYWARGVGPVRIEFRHAGGELSTSELVATNLAARALPPDDNYLPLNRGKKFRLRWSNSKYMKKPSTQEFEVAEVVNNSARVDVKNVSGPIRVRGSYAFATRISGITNLSGATRASSLVHFPKLGPKGAASADRRRFTTPLDLMLFGFGPVLPTYPKQGDEWKGVKGTLDYSSFGVTGTSEVIGFERVQTPLGRLRALVVRSKLTQSGFPFGSGTRTSWFAPGRGLVKLVFRHRDGSVSTVYRVK
ncbi:MAG: hypothetical protein QOJ89_4353 [bacterium]|jgi:hypothetical protein